MDHDTVANELLEEGNRRVLQRDHVNLAAERIGERCGKLEEVGPGSVHGHVYVRARVRGSAGLRAEEHGYPNVLATGEGVVQAGSELLDGHRPSLPLGEEAVTAPGDGERAVPRHVFHRSRERPPRSHARPPPITGPSSRTSFQPVATFALVHPRPLTRGLSLTP